MLIPFLAGKDIFIVPGVIQNEVQLEAPLVFVGYGIEIPGKYSDYKNIDVKGKIVVFLNGTPQGIELPSTLTAHFASPASKMEIAAQKGALGAIAAPGSEVAVINTSSTTSAAMNPEKTKAFGRSVAGGLTAAARIPFTTLQRLFFNSGINLSQTLTNLKKGIPASTELSSSLRLTYT